MWIHSFLLLGFTLFFLSCCDCVLRTFQCRDGIGKRRKKERGREKKIPTQKINSLSLSLPLSWQTLLSRKREKCKENCLTGMCFRNTEWGNHRITNTLCGRENSAVARFTSSQCLYFIFFPFLPLSKKPSECRIYKLCCHKNEFPLLLAVKGKGKGERMKKKYNFCSCPLHDVLRRGREAGFTNATHFEIYSLWKAVPVCDGAVFELEWILTQKKTLNEQKSKKKGAWRKYKKP